MIFDPSLISASADYILAAPPIGGGTGGGAGLPELTPEQPPFAQKFLDLGQMATWAAYLASAIALIYAGAKMGYEKYMGGQVESPKRMAAVIFGAIVVASATAIVNWASS